MPSAASCSAFFSGTRPVFFQGTRAGEWDIPMHPHLWPIRLSRNTWDLSNNLIIYWLFHCHIPDPKARSAAKLWGTYYTYVPFVRARFFVHHLPSKFFPCSSILCPIYITTTKINAWAPAPNSRGFPFLKHKTVQKKRHPMKDPCPNPGPLPPGCAATVGAATSSQPSRTQLPSATLTPSAAAG